VPSSAPAPRFFGRRCRGRAAINLDQLEIKINKEKSRKYQASRINQAKIKGKSREIQDKSSKSPEISQNLTKSH
jgi:hypothetical protein